LSNQTFGKRPRVKVGENEYVFQEYRVDNLWLDFIDPEQRALFTNEHCSNLLYLRRVLIGGFFATMILTCLHAHGLFSEVDLSAARVHGYLFGVRLGLFAPSLSG
jgi:hypothetical protein